MIFSPSRVAACGRPQLARKLAVGLAIAIAALVRLSAWDEVFTPSGVRLTGDDDALYHLLRTERMIAGAPGAPWRDPGLNYPNGAEIPWPPLFDVVLAGAGYVAAGGAAPDSAQLEHGASFVPVICALATVVLVAVLGGALAGNGGAAAAFILALLPAHATFTQLGRTDQHAAELLLIGLAFLPVSWGLRNPMRLRRTGRILLAFTLVLSFWNWLGSALYPLLLVAFVAAWTVQAPARDAVARRLAGDLAAGCGLGAVLLATTVALVRGPASLAEMSLAGISGAQPLFLAMAAAFGAALLVVDDRPALVSTRARRLGMVAAAAMLPALTALAVPGFWSAAERGFIALARANAWYRGIQEFTPILFGGWEPLSAELRHLVAAYGLVLVLVPFAFAALVRRLRDGGERASAAFLLFWAASFLVLGFARRRFALYLTAPLAICAGLVVNEWARHAAAYLSHRLPMRESLLRCGAAVALATVLVAPGLALLDENVGGEDRVQREVRGMVEALRTAPEAPHRHAVLSQWAFGHLVQFASARPVVTSPFGTEGGEGSMEDAAAFFLAEDEDEAEAVLARRRVGFVLLADPVSEVAMLQTFRPEQPAVVRLRPTWTDGMQVETAPGYRSLVAVRLFEGPRAPGEPGPSGFRLLDESRLGPRGIPMFKVFGVVSGARLVVSGAQPGAPVAASTRLMSRRRAHEWTTYAEADESGTATLRVPYASGANGKITAAPYIVSDGASRGLAIVSEASVIAGAVVGVKLSAATAAMR